MAIKRTDSSDDALAHLKYDTLGLRREIHRANSCEEMSK